MRPRRGTWVQYLRNPRLWFGVPAVVVGVVVGLLTNIVTTTPTWPVVVGLIAAVVVWVGLTVWQAARDEKDRLGALRAARDELLEPLQPGLQGTHTIRTLLAAEHPLARFVARDTETKNLLGWCLDPAASPVEVLAGPSGVGKSRLAVEVARRLPDGWVAGRCARGKAAQLLAAVLAGREPTLVVVDDADTQPGVASLVEQVGTRVQRGEVKVLLVVREADIFETWLNQQLPDAHRVQRPTMTLAVVGGPGDRRRWFVEAARAYAAALGVPPPPVSDVDTRPVGAEGDPMILTQARAVLAALAGTRERADALRTASIDRIATGLVEHERQRWERAADDPQWDLQTGVTATDREEALLGLVLLGPSTAADAVRVLQRLPRFRDQPEHVVYHVADWAHHLYPGAQAGLVEPSPDFLRDALLAGLAQPEHAELTHSLLSALPEEQGPAVLTRLIRAAALFTTVAPLVGETVGHQPRLLAVAIESLVLSGPAAWVVERHLVDPIASQRVSAQQTERLLELLERTQFTHLRAALHRCVVQHAREALGADDTENTRVALATVLHNLGIRLWALGRYREALHAHEEALGLRRKLAQQEPARHTPDLANMLSNCAITLCQLACHDEELQRRTEVVVRWRILARRDPDQHQDSYQREQDRLAGHFARHNREPDEARRAEEDLAHRLGLDT